MEDTNSLIEQRKAKLKSLEAKGIFPFKNKFTPDIGAGEARAKFEGGELAEHAKVAAIPVTAFYEGDAPNHFVRFAFCKKPEILREAIARRMGQEVLAL